MFTYRSHTQCLPRRAAAASVSYIMMSSPRSPLRPWAQRTIDATNLPFRALEYVFTPLVAYSHSLHCLLCRVVKQNSIFVCIFYLHIWQTFKDSPPIRPLARHWTRMVCGLLFGCYAACAVLMLCVSGPLFVASWRDTSREDSSSGTASVRVHHLALFVLTCAPACAMLGASFAAVYYTYKHHRYGVYLANMRKLGRGGYWADPRDFEGWRRASSREEAIERLKAWDLVENKVSFIVDRVCVGCGAVKEGLSSRCETCGDHGERMVRRRDA